jgi:hypothetical protein
MSFDTLVSTLPRGRPRKDVELFDKSRGGSELFTKSVRTFPGCRHLDAGGVRALGQREEDFVRPVLSRMSAARLEGAPPTRSPAYLSRRRHRLRERERASQSPPLAAAAAWCGPPHRRPRRIGSPAVAGAPFRPKRADSQTGKASSANNQNSKTLSPPPTRFRLLSSASSERSVRSAKKTADAVPACAIQAKSPAPRPQTAPATCQPVAALRVICRILLASCRSSHLLSGL